MTHATENITLPQTSFPGGKNVDANLENSFVKHCLLNCFCSNDRADLDWSNDLEDALLNKPGVGCRCMDPSVYSIE